MTPRVLLHRAGPEVSRVAFGCWRLARSGLSAEALRELVAQSADLGVTTFDHADLYGDYTVETLFGDALAAAPDLRRRLQLVTKCGIRLPTARFPGNPPIKVYDSSAAHIRASVERSLAALRVERIDVLLLHRPDPLMDADETAAVLGSLVRAGKVAHVGVSNFTPAQVDLLADRMDVPLVTHQVELSPLAPEAIGDGRLDQCHRPHPQPLALVEVGAAHGGRAVDQVAFAWLLAHPAGIVPVTGTCNVDRLRAAADAAALTLTREQWFAVWTAALGQEPP